MEYKRIQFGFRAGLVIFYFFSLFSLGAIESEWKDQIVENQRFTLKYITSFHGGSTVQIVDPVWPDGISKISGPYTAQRTIQREDQTFATVLQVIYTLRGDKAGIFSIPPVSVSNGDETQVSDSLTVPVLRKDESFLYYPLILDWVSLPETLYIGQSVPLVLIMKNLEEISLPDQVTLQTPDASILENVTGLGDIQFSAFGDKTLYHVPMDTWMLTPSKTGNLVLGSAQVRMMGLTRKTDSRTIQILPLPDSVSMTGAVGTFEYSLKLPGDKGVVGEPLSISIRVEGTGNLNYLVLPEPLFPESLTVVRKEVSDYTATSAGFAGYREVQYALTPDSPGSLNIEVPGFISLNPVTGQISRTPERNLNFEITSLLDSLKDDDSNKFALFSPDQVLRGTGASFFRNPFLYIFLLPGILIFIVMKSAGLRRASLMTMILSSLFFTGAAIPDIGMSSALNEAELHFNNGEFGDALVIYNDPDSSLKHNAYFLYNRGVLQYLNHQKAEAVSSLRTALYLKPASSQISNTLESIEERLGLDHQYSLRVLVSPDTLFIMLLFSVNLVFLLISIPSVRGKSTVVVLMVLLVLTGLLSGAELIRSSWVLRRSEAVIRQDVSIRKIPDIKGSPWISLPEGTSVEIVKDYQGFVLISTAYGLEGWLPSQDIIKMSRGKDDEI